MLTSKSTQGCRLKATDPATIRSVGSTGLWTGTVDLATMPGKSARKGRKPSKRTTKGNARKCRQR